MPKKVKELSAAEIRRIVHPGKGRNVCFSVGGVDGLQLQVTPTGARSWLLRVIVKGKRRQLGLGAYPDVPLAQARERAREIKQKIWDGIDPLEERQRLTFAQAMEQTLLGRYAALSELSDACQGHVHQRLGSAQRTCWIGVL